MHVFPLETQTIIEGNTYPVQTKIKNICRDR